MTWREYDVGERALIIAAAIGCGLVAFVLVALLLVAGHQRGERLRCAGGPAERTVLRPCGQGCWMPMHEVPPAPGVCPQFEQLADEEIETR